MRRLGQRLDLHAPPSPRGRGGLVAGFLCPSGQRAEHAGQLGGVRVARTLRPVAVEAVEELTAARSGGGLQVTAGEEAAELLQVDVDGVGQRDPVAGDHHRVAAQRTAQLVQRVA
jgi:hypothetical protein